MPKTAPKAESSGADQNPVLTRVPGIQSLFLGFSSETAVVILCSQFSNIGRQ